MKNPYNTGVAAAEQIDDDGANSTDGLIAIFCTAGATGVCKVRTYNGEAELVDTIPRY